MTNDKQICSVCGRELPQTDFWKIKEPFTDWHKIKYHRYNICKECCYETKLLNESDNNNIKLYCEFFNVPFILKEWEMLKKRYYPKRHIFGRYIARMNLAGYRPYQYKDSEELNKFYE